MPITLDGYTDISVQEAWDMLNDPSPSNGIQIPIDVRTDSEWYGERINTPYPEDPRHYCLSDLQIYHVSQVVGAFQQPIFL